MRPWRVHMELTLKSMEVICLKLNYGSINNNWGNFKKKVRSYDYKVGTAEDLGKLYLEPHMAKFTGIS